MKKIFFAVIIACLLSCSLFLVSSASESEDVGLDIFLNKAPSANNVHMNDIFLREAYYDHELEQNYMVYQLISPSDYIWMYKVQFELSEDFPSFVLYTKNSNGVNQVLMQGDYVTQSTYTLTFFGGSVYYLQFDEMTAESEFESSVHLYMFETINSGCFEIIWGEYYDSQEYAEMLEKEIADAKAEAELRAQEEIDRLISETEKLESENKNLLEEKMALEENSAALEETAKQLTEQLQKILSSIEDKEKNKASLESELSNFEERYNSFLIELENKYSQYMTKEEADAYIQEQLALKLKEKNDEEDN